MSTATGSAGRAARRSRRRGGGSGAGSPTVRSARCGASGATSSTLASAGRSAPAEPGAPLSRALASRARTNRSATVRREGASSSRPRSRSSPWTAGEIEVALDLALDRLRLRSAAGRGRSSRRARAGRRRQGCGWSSGRGRRSKRFSSIAASGSPGASWSTTSIVPPGRSTRFISASTSSGRWRWWSVRAVETRSKRRAERQLVRVGLDERDILGRTLPGLGEQFLDEVDADDLAYERRERDRDRARRPCPRRARCSSPVSGSRRASRCSVSGRALILQVGDRRPPSRRTACAPPPTLVADCRANRCRRPAPGRRRGPGARRGLRVLPHHVMRMKLLIPLAGALALIAVCVPQRRCDDAQEDRGEAGRGESDARRDPVIDKQLNSRLGAVRRGAPPADGAATRPEERARLARGRQEPLRAALQRAARSSSSGSTPNHASSLDVHPRRARLGELLQLSDAENAIEPAGDRDRRSRRRPAKHSLRQRCAGSTRTARPPPRRVRELAASRAEILARPRRARRELLVSVQAEVSRLEAVERARQARLAAEARARLAAELAAREKAAAAAAAAHRPLAARGARRAGEGGRRRRRRNHAYEAARGRPRPPRPATTRDEHGDRARRHRGRARRDDPRAHRRSPPSDAGHDTDPR